MPSEIVNIAWRPFDDAPHAPPPPRAQGWALKIGRLALLLPRDWDLFLTRVYLVKRAPSVAERSRDDHCRGTNLASEEHHWRLAAVVVVGIGCVPLKVEAHDPCLIGHQWLESTVVGYVCWGCPGVVAPQK